MFVVSLLQNGTCRRGWVTQTEPAFRSVPLTYSNNINCVLWGQEACPLKRIQSPPLSARARPLGKPLRSRCVQVKAEFGFLKYTYELSDEVCRLGVWLGFNAIT